MVARMRYIVAILLLLFSAPAVAEPVPAKTGSQQHRSWAAFSYDENGAPTCYAASRPSERKGLKTGIDNAFAYITQRPAEKTLNVFHYAPGFELLLGSTVTVRIDNDKFTLFSTSDGAWARGNDTDRAIAAALRKGKRMTVTATTQGKVTVTDTFSLSGSGLALDAVNKMCGLD